MIPGDAIPGGFSIGRAPRWHRPDGWSLVLDCGWERDVMLENPPSGSCGDVVLIGDAIRATSAPWHVGDDIYRVSWYRQGTSTNDQSLPLVNGGAEDDIANPVGWTDAAGAVGNLAVNGTYDAAEGDQYFESSFGDEVLAYQDVAIPDVDDAHAFIDAGTSALVLEVSHGTASGLTSPPDRHDAQLQVEFYDASMTLIGSKVNGAMYSSQGANVWTRYGEIIPVPVGARTIRLFQHYPQRKESGSHIVYHNWGQVDDITMDLRTQSIAFLIQQVWQKGSLGAVPSDYPQPRDGGTGQL